MKNKEKVPMKLKFYLSRLTIIGSSGEAIEQTESWISYYNAERPHSAIRMMAPLAYEAQLLKR